MCFKNIVFKSNYFNLDLSGFENLTDLFNLPHTPIYQQADNLKLYI